LCKGNGFSSFVPRICNACNTDFSTENSEDIQPRHIKTEKEFTIVKTSPTLVRFFCVQNFFILSQSAKFHSIFALVKNLLFFAFLFASTYLKAQDSLIWVSFHPSVKQNKGFDVAKPTLYQNYYPTFQVPNGQKIHSSYKILAKGKSDVVRVQLHGDTTLDWSQVTFYFGQEELIPRRIDKTTAILILSKPTVSNDVLAVYNGMLIGKLKTMVYPEKKKSVVVVPLSNKPLKEKILKEQLQQIYSQANIALAVEIAPPFQTAVFTPQTIFSSTDSLHNRYSGQMRLLRDQYFTEHPGADRNAFYLFIIPGFLEARLTGFMVPDKAIGFVPYQTSQNRLAIQLARTLAQGMGALDDDWIHASHLVTENLMDTTHGTKLTHFQITKLQRDISIYSRLDAYENVKTNNGTIAYYFWEEDENGAIILDGKSYSNGLRQPFKMNFLAYRFDVKYAIMRPFFRFGKYYISILNFLFLFGLLFLLFWQRRKIKELWERKHWRNSWRRMLFWLSLVIAFFPLKYSFGWGNDFLDIFKKVSGPIPELQDLTYREAKQKLFSIAEIRKQGEANLCSEILVRKKGTWEMKKRGQVLYFELQEKPNGEEPSLHLVATNDSLILENENFQGFARTHYLVYTRKSVDGETIGQEVFTYNREKIESLKNQVNPPRRILVFANGYRPTSTGQNFGESFKGIQSKGLEYPNSSNYIYKFDRYDYWQPWNEINLQFQNRINPSFTFYADGHHSVSTSDYKSLINFTRISQAYPLRCKNPKKHTCWRVKNDEFTRFILPTTQTEKLLKMSANHAGFAYRKKKGRIAGMNLLQELNPFPNQSENDTLFIVAHSMGYAYSLGMIEVLRGKINFGGFYILAPENAKSGYVNPDEWQQVWQYGSRFNLTNSDAPCLQDGIAPQTGAKGLSFENRVFIPENLYLRKGFFDSHFVGYYDWILKIPATEKGYMKQR